MSDTLDRRPPGDERPSGEVEYDEIGLANSPIRLVMLVGVFVALGFAFGVNALVVLAAIVVSIFLHESGHYLAARATGMKATEFFIGFGPKLWSFRRGETEYGVKLIWLGAYVKIIGMNNLEEVPEGDESRTFRKQSYPKRVLVAFAGPAMNLVFALVLMFILFSAVGVPESDFPRLGVLDESAASESGMETGDEIVSIAGQPIDEFADMSAVLADHAGEPVEVVVLRDDETLRFEPTLGERVMEDGTRVGFLGVSADQVTAREGVVEAAGSSAEAFGHLTYQSVTGLVRFFSPAGLSGFAEQVVSTPPAGEDAQVSPAGEPDSTVQGGPVAEADAAPADTDRVISILGVIQIGRQLGLAEIIGLMAALNIFLALFNLIPLLPFDGGHIAVATYERIRSRHGVRYTADYAKLIPVTYVVVALIVSVGLGAIYLDAVNPVQIPN